MKPDTVKQATKAVQALEQAGIPVYDVDFTQEGYLLDLGNGSVVGPKVIDSGEKSIEPRTIDSGEKH